MKPLVCVCFLFLVFSCQKPMPQAPVGMVYVPAGGAMKAFFMDISPVTVLEFERFVKATHYTTQAEDFGDAGIFRFDTGGWALEKGANYRYPFGKKTQKATDNEPVTQVSWNDALAYARWAGKRLPSRAEWEHAAKNGQFNYSKIYAWGDAIIENGKYKANFWQGNFPILNTNDDGYLSTCPVGTFGKTPLGLTDMGGNVWQWTSDNSEEKPEEKLQCGGSYLCDPKVCHGFKIHNTASSTPETSLCHVGFRCVKDL